MLLNACSVGAGLMQSANVIRTMDQSVPGTTSGPGTTGKTSLAASSAGSVTGESATCNRPSRALAKATPSAAAEPRLAKAL